MMALTCNIRLDMARGQWKLTMFNGSPEKH